MPTARTFTGAYAGNLCYSGTTFAGTLVSAPDLCGPTLYPSCWVMIALANPIDVYVFFSDPPADYICTSDIVWSAAARTLSFYTRSSGYTLFLIEAGALNGEDAIVSSRPERPESSGALRAPEEVNE